jgi:hypothetical protein
MQQEAVLAESLTDVQHRLRTELLQKKDNYWYLVNEAARHCAFS